MMIENMLFERDDLKKIIEKREFNGPILNHYRRYLYTDNVQNELSIPKKIIKNHISYMEDCNRIWLLDKYEKSKIKDFKKTNLCRNRMCSNCKVVKSAERKMKFYPFIEEQKNLGNYVYHLVLTAPKVPGEELKSRIKLMFKQFGQALIRYLNGSKKIKGVSFAEWGFHGAIRSLEVTYKTNSDLYHPHLHVMLVLQNEIMSGEPSITNSFSKDKYNKKALRLFTAEEELIQKIWFLLMNNIKVNKDNIEDLKEGYSCTIDKFDDNYNELFKYMTKTNEGELTYNNFRILLEHLRSVRQIQGYGCFFNVVDDDEDISEEVDKIYDEFIAKLKEKELPKSVGETLEKLFNDEEYALISRKRIFKTYKQLLNEKQS